MAGLLSREEKEVSVISVSVGEKQRAIRMPSQENRIEHGA
jgi:hypothetical protein